MVAANIYICWHMGPLVAQLVKNLLAIQETLFYSWVRKLPWRRDRLSTPVFLGFPGGSDGKELAWNAGDLGSIPGSGRFTGGEHGNTLPSILAWRIPMGWAGGGDCSPWGCKESDTIEQGSIAHNRYTHAKKKRTPKHNTKDSHSVKSEENKKERIRKDLQN